VFQIFAGQRVVQVLNDVELDVALAQEIQRATRLASTRVVIDEHFRHRFPLYLSNSSQPSWLDRS